MAILDLMRNNFNIRLIDGSVRAYEKDSDDCITCLKIAQDISSSLAKKAVAAKINGKQCDLDHLVKDNDIIEIITLDTEEGLDVIRHDAAHVLAQAVKELYPSIQVTIGPTIKDGFFYDFAKNEPFSANDLIKIEEKMEEIIKRNDKIVRKVVSKNEAIEYFHSINEHYKIEIINKLPESEEISMYSQGNFTDLCRGPHAPSTGYIKAFKLMKVAGAYWRGNSNNVMLQRIYGTAWTSKKDLDQYLYMIEEAEKRDHRKLGKEMDLFHFQDEAPGAVFWHQKGWIIFQTLITYMRQQQHESGYVEINTPEILNRSLWEASGHWEKYRENMYTATVLDEDRVYAVRPMCCPGAIQVFNHGLVSYKELPMRLSEFGKVYRYEPSGSLYGLMRVRAFTQDDAHIFCTEDQIMSESINLCKLLFKIYADFGFDNVKVKFSDRPDKRIGDDNVWDKAEAALLNALKDLGVEYTTNKGEGAFYGPKLEFVLRDAIGRDWQMGTLQVDLNLPRRLNAQYIGEDGQKHYPVMLHRAVFGSLERFIGMLIEHYTGKLPLWLAPMQLCIMTITDEEKDFVKQLEIKAKKLGIRVIVDLDNETLNYKIRKHSLNKIPYIAIVGKKEAAEGSVSVRKFGAVNNNDGNTSPIIAAKQEIFSANDFFDMLLKEI